MYDVEKISLYKYQHDDMIERLAKLDALEKGGVENWEYYDHSLRHWTYEKSKKDLIYEIIQDVNDLLSEADVDEPAGHGAGYRVSFDEDALARYLDKHLGRFLEIENGKPKE